MRACGDDTRSAKSEFARRSDHTCLGNGRDRHHEYRTSHKCGGSTGVGYIARRGVGRVNGVRGERGTTGVAGGRRSDDADRDSGRYSPRPRIFRHHGDRHRARRRPRPRCVVAIARSAQMNTLPRTDTASDQLHPGAWWTWSLALGGAATRTTNPLILVLLVAVAGFVVHARRSPESSRTFWFFVRLGVVIVAARIVFDVMFGGQHTGFVVLNLPSVPLPNWAAGLHLGGAITTQELLTATYGGLQLATLVVCVGSANALANPRRLLRTLPGSLYEVGVAITVALSFAPQLAQAAVRVRRARRLRGLRSTGLRSWWSVAVPVLEDALDRSIELAAAMDARGFGRTGQISRRQRRLVAAGVLAGLLAIVVSVYEILDVGSPVLAGVPLLVAGTALALIAVLLGGRHRSRTTYRPASWRITEWGVLATGLAAIAGVLIGGRVEPGALHTTIYPLAIPQLPWPTLVGIALALLPGIAMSTARGDAPQFRAVRGELPAVARR